MSIQSPNFLTALKVCIMVILQPFVLSAFFYIILGKIFSCLFLCAFFTGLGITLVVFFDGATQESKRPVWVSRRLQSMKKAHAVFDALKNGLEVKNLNKDLYVLPAGAGSVMSSISRSRCAVNISDYFLY